jgi:hypothetical protein
MSQAVRRALRVGLYIVCLGMGLMNAGCASDRSWFSSWRGQGPETPYVVQRPSYAIEGTRPLYLGGYAGANYRPYALPGRQSN